MNNQQGQQPPRSPGQFKWPPTNQPQQGWSIPQQSPYGQQPDGQPQWGYQPPAQPFQQPYHQPFQQPSLPPPKRHSLGRLLVILGVVCALLLASIVATVIVSRSNNVATNNTHVKGTTTPAQQVTSTPVQQATSTPTHQVTSTPAQQATSTPTPRAITIISDQTNVVDDIWTVTLNTVQKSSGAGSQTPKSGDIFLIVDVSLKNTSTSSQTTSSRSAFALQNSSNGQAYTEVTAIGGTPDGTVAAGGTIRGKITYEVPQSVHNFTLQCTPDLTSDASAQWHISI
jgi:cytoskeletal protein RodZ